MKHLAGLHRYFFEWECNNVECNVIVSFGPWLLIAVSHVFIFYAILRINSVKGRKKAFSPVQSTIKVIIMSYGTILFLYMKLKPKDMTSDKLINLFNGIVILMVNTIIYSLSNKKVQAWSYKTLVLEKMMWNSYLWVQLHKRNSCILRQGF